jgi:hypothetical protein
MKSGNYDDEYLASETKVLPKQIEINPRFSLSQPIRQDGYPYYPDVSPYRIRTTTQEEAKKVAHEFFSDILVERGDKYVEKEKYDELYYKWVKYMTNLPISEDSIEDYVCRTPAPASPPRRPERYRRTMLAKPRWIVYVGPMEYEEDPR